MVAWTWANAVFWSMVPLVGWSRITYEPSKLSCTLDLLNPDWKYILYIFLTFILFYIVPILFIFYLRINHAPDGTVRTQELKQRLNVRGCFSSYFLFLSVLVVVC